MGDLFRYLAETRFLGRSLEHLIAALLIILAGALVRRLVGRVVLRFVSHLTKRTRTELDDLLVEASRRPLEAGVMLIFVAVAVSVLQLPEAPVNVRRIVNVLLSLATTVVVTWLIFRLVDALAEYFHRVAVATESKVDDALIPLGRKAAKVFLSLLAFVVALQNIGYSVSGLLAGLGIGGLALALAAQDTVANLFGSVMILLDRPFQVGDWIKGANFEGTVEEIGFRSTRVRTLPKTLVTVPNKQVADMVIDNQQAMPVRRIQMDLGVSYETTPEQMRQAVTGIRALLDASPGLWQEGTLVRFHEFGPSSLNIAVRCFTAETAQDEHMRLREELHFKVMDLFQSLGIGFAFPRQTVYFGGGKALDVQLDPARPSSAGSSSTGARPGGPPAPGPVGPGGA